MAVRADHVALCYLGEQTHAVHKHGATIGHLKALLRGIAMIEVHLIWLERAAAVGARYATKLAQEFDRRVLARADALDLLRAIARVVRHVERSLARSDPHAPI